MNLWNESSLQALQNQDSPWYPWQKEQLKTFLLNGFPDRKVESWKYTNVSCISEQVFSFNKRTNANISRFILDNLYRVVFINGYFEPKLSNLSELPSEIQLTSIRNIQENIENKLTTKDYQTPFSLMNDALFQDGLFLRVPKDCHLEKPLHLIYLSESAIPLSMSQTRNIIFLEENAKAVIFEEYHGMNDVVYFNNMVTQIDVKMAAHLEFYKLQQEGNHAFHIANTSIHQDRHSQVTSCYVTLGGKMSRDDLNYSLDKVNASCQLLGFYYARNGCHVDNHTLTDHRAPHCGSQQHYRGILVDKSRAVFNGKIIVHPYAKKTTAHQTNKNLILSSDAEIDTKPELEIYNDDVKCTHSATVGNLNKEVIFYLQSRGINRSTAENLLTYAFANEVVEMLPNKLIADCIYQYISDCLREKVEDHILAPHCQRKGYHA